MINFVIQFSLNSVILFSCFTNCCFFKINFNYSVINLNNNQKLQKESKRICTNTRIENLINQLQTLKGSSIEIASVLKELVSCGSQAVPALIEVFENEKEKIIVRRIVARALGQIGSEEAISVLVKAAIKKKSPLYDSAIRALDDSALGLIFLITTNPPQQVYIDIQNAVPLLVKALSHDDENIRSAAAEALSEIGIDARIAIPNLIRLIGNDTRIVQAEAINALGQMGKEGINDLIEAIKHGKISFNFGAIALIQLEKNPNVRDAVERATPFLLDSFRKNRITLENTCDLVYFLYSNGQRRAAEEVLSALENRDEYCISGLQSGGAELALEAATSRGIARQPAICRFSLMRRILWRCR
ncbi:HEAT repeat domain-containing protein [Nostoc sp. UIC 10607]|uniref:HEAT repeat domain-containing protein n=1 Tax=Nostoc sp. UIC 10607 TaxID=3045935 RepID=UPI00399FA614